MTTFTDTLTIGIVFLLLFGSIAFYLYTCIQQMEQKLSLQESILLDMKMAAEVKGYSELPAVEAPPSGAAPASAPSTPQPSQPSQQAPVVDYPPFEESIDVEELSHASVEDYQAALSEGVAAAEQEYEHMTLKELQAAAKSRGLSTSGKNKAQLLEALRGVSASAADSVNSFLETSSVIAA
jgi:hypothetical protein